MTIPTPPLRVGERVRAICAHGGPGTVLVVRRASYSVALDNGPTGWYGPAELERLDDQMDFAYGSGVGTPSDLPRPPANDAVDQSAGQHPAPESATPVAPVAVAAFSPEAFVQTLDDLMLCGKGVAFADAGRGKTVCTISFDDDRGDLTSQREASGANVTDALFAAADDWMNQE